MNAASDQGDGAKRALRVVHVSADFPDSVVSHKTPVIERLIALVPEPVQHEVYSLNRVSPGLLGAMRGAFSGWGRNIASLAEPFGHTVRYAAPGKGLFHVGALLDLGAWLADRIDGGERPDLLFGHKLTVEGIAVRHAAKRLGVPYGVTIQGNTDLKILNARPDLRRAIAPVFHEAAYVISFAPWSLDSVEALLGKRNGPSEVLPCPPDFADMIAPDHSGTGLLSVFHLHNATGKNLPRMVQAMDRIAPRHPGAELTIVGGGSAADVARAEAMVAGHANVVLAGAMDRAQLRAAMNGAAGLVLPSMRESFGLVFVEALLSGLPIIYPKGAAVDGYFDNCPFAIPVDARNTGEIAAAMELLLEDNTARKQALADWQKSTASQRFLPPAIGAQFRKILQSAAVRQ